MHVGCGLVDFRFQQLHPGTKILELISKSALLLGHLFAKRFNMLSHFLSNFLALLDYLPSEIPFHLLHLSVLGIHYKRENFGTNSRSKY